MATINRTLITVAVATALGGMAAGAIAGGFAIGTQSGSGTGNAFAGGAAAADDASVAWFNPALMPLIPGKQIAGALHAVKPSFKFENQGSTGVFSCVSPPFPPCPGGEGGDGGDWAFIPNAFFTMAINPSLSFGLALNAPFGLKTEYEDGWRGQLTTLKSEVKSVNMSPSVAYKASNTVSIGFGLNAQMLDAELTSFGGSAAAGIVKVEADDIGFGFNLGIMIQASPSTRIGAHYRSKIKYELEGNASFSGTSGALLGSNISADLEVPDSFSLSVFQSLGNWELLGDVTWTGWSSLQQLQIIRTSATGAGQPAGSTLTTLQFQWDDTWRYAIGANYRMSPQTKLRFGVAFDETPTNDQFRTARLPDQDRTWVALGVQYKPTKTSILDIGYAHEFIKDAQINNTVPPAPGALTGKFENKADIFSIQYSQSF